MNIPDNDRPWGTETITGVRDDEGGWVVLMDSTGIFVPNDLCKQRPEPGERASFYGKGFGYEVRGIVINGRVYRYRTEAEAKQDHERWVEDQNAKRQAELNADRLDRDRRIASLPPEFRARIERFQSRRPDWRRDHEPYELFVCEEAVKIAAWASSRMLLTPARTSLEMFRDDRELQEKVLGASYHEHSGNTFSAALGLAAVYLQHPELVPRAHGALCPLVGCQDYGCWAADKDGG